MNEKELVIWFKDGNTAYFKPITSFEERNGELLFAYHGLLTNTDKIAHFYIKNIAGWAIKE